MSIVASAVESLIGKLGEALNEEGIFTPEVRRQAGLMKEEFMYMEAFLRDADARLGDERQNYWARSVLSIAHEAEDAIDTFACDVGPQRQGRRQLLRCASIVNRLDAFHKLGTVMDRVRAKMLAAQERTRTDFGIELGSTRATSSSHDHSSFMDHSFSLDAQEPDFVGFHDELESLIQYWNNGEQQGWVVSIVGMGGLGKITLAQNAFNDLRFKRNFDILARVFVSQQFFSSEFL